MGVERAVTRWYLQRQMILNEIAQLEEQIVLLQGGYSRGIQLVTVEETKTQIIVASDEQTWDVISYAQRSVSIDQQMTTTAETPLSEDEARLVQQWQAVQAKLKGLGHCPKPMMG